MMREPDENTATVARSSGESLSRISEQARLAFFEFRPFHRAGVIEQNAQIEREGVHAASGRKFEQNGLQKVAARGAKLFI